MKHARHSTVRIEAKVHRRILLTRIDTDREHRVLCEAGPLTHRMQPGQVWRVRWRSARTKGEPEWIVLLDAQPVPSAWED